METLLSTAEVARRLGVTSQTVIVLARSGDLYGSFFARAWKFRPEDVDAFVASHRRVR